MRWIEEPEGGIFEDPSAAPEKRFKAIGAGAGWYDPDTWEKLHRRQVNHGTRSPLAAISCQMTPGERTSPACRRAAGGSGRENALVHADVLPLPLIGIGQLQPHGAILALTTDVLDRAGFVRLGAAPHDVPVL